MVRVLNLVGHEILSYKYYKTFHLYLQRKLTVRGTNETTIIYVNKKL